MAKFRLPDRVSICSPLPPQYDPFARRPHLAWIDRRIRGHLDGEGDGTGDVAMKIFTAHGIRMRYARRCSCIQ